MSGKLSMLILEKSELEKSMKDKLTLKNRNFFEKRVNQLKERISKFGQRYGIVEVTISYFTMNNEYRKKIYYTDLSEEDAINYTRVIMEGAFKIKEITAIKIPVGALINV